MRLAIDSNRYSDLMRGVPDVGQVVRNAAEIYVPLMVLAEQRAGYAHGTRREENERALTAFLNLEGVHVLCPDAHTSHVYADLYAYLRARGKPIPTNDLWIASLVIQHDLVLFDRDSDFDRLPQLARIRL